MKTRNAILTKFTSNEYPNGYFGIVRDYGLLEENCYTYYLYPLQRGLELAAQYYHFKYGTNIIFPNVHCRDFAKNIIQFLPEKNNLPYQYRQAFLLTRGTHSVPFIYIKEGDKEGILYADSLGSDMCGHWAEKSIESSGRDIEIYMVLQPRQSDRHSCYIDSLIIARDATKINKDNNEYVIDHLLSRLRNRKEIIHQFSTNSNSFFALLPNELLKTAQLSSFVLKHQETDANDKIIHKNESLTQFRHRYTETFTVVNKSKPNKTKPISSYLNKKSLKIAYIIEIQFYINEFCRLFQENFTAENTQEFIDIAKNELKSYTDLYDVDILNSQTRLYNFAINFMATIGQKMNSPGLSKSVSSKPL